jgi:hypothetical protein
MRVVRGCIEFKVQKLRKPFREGVHALAVFPFIWYEADRWDDMCLQRHERYHWKDQLRWLWLPWFVVYFALMLFYGGGDRHPLERRGYSIERACNGR